MSEEIIGTVETMDGLPGEGVQAGDEAVYGGSPPPPIVHAPEGLLSAEGELLVIGKGVIG